jgi:tetratricopeptide (TPR) repeat protein
MEMPTEVEIAASDPGNRFGRYLRVQLLGQGGMGEVWKGWDTQLHRWVALKFPRYENAEDLTRLAQEAQSSGQLSHPNIAAVFEFGQAQGKHFIAMEFVDGETLSALHQREESRKDRRKLIDFIRRAVLGVAYAHTHGIVHRDIKPENIMIGRDGHVYVMDFGIARRTTATLTSTSAGTPPYMSPEQIEGKRVDGRTDVWSLGASLYELLADRRPFEGSSVGEITKRILGEDPAPLRQSDADLNTVVMKCLEKEPARRYATAQELADDLQRFLEGEPIAAHPASLLYRVRKRIGRRKAVALAVLMAAIAGFAILRIAGSAVERRTNLRNALAEGAQSLKEAKLRAASRQYQRALELDPSSSEAKEAVRVIESRMTRARGYWNEGRDLLSGLDRLLATELGTNAEVQQNLERVRVQLGKALAEYADYPEAHYEMARSYVLTRNSDRPKAIDHCNATLEADSTFLPAYLVRGILWLESYENQSIDSATGTRRLATARAEVDLRKAQEDLRQVESLGTNSRETIYARGLLAFAEGKWDLAAPKLQEYAALSVSDSQGWRLAGKAFFFQGKDEDAIQAFTKALAFRPKDEDTHLMRGHAHNRKGAQQFQAGKAVEGQREIKAAAEDYGKAGPGLFAKNGLAATLIGLQDYKGAVEAYDRVLEQNPEDGSSLNNRGYAHWMLGNDEKAIRDYTRAIELDGRAKDPQLGMGDLHLKARAPQKAIPYYTKAIEIDEAYAHRNNAFTSRARARFEVGDLEGAIVDYTKASTLTPVYRYAPLHLWYLSQQVQGATREAARSQLGKARSLFKEGEWPSPVYSLYMGEIDLARFMTLAGDKDAVREKGQLCEAHYYAAQLLMTEGNKSTAADYFKMCIATGPQDFVEFFFATAVLSRKGQ